MNQTILTSNGVGYTYATGAIGIFGTLTNTLTFIYFIVQERYVIQSIGDAVRYSVISVTCFRSII